MPNYDLILHQWKLLPWGGEPAARTGSINAAAGVGGGAEPFLGFFATLAKQRPVPQLPLAVRSAFRPVLTALPNAPLLLEAMLLTNGFLGARALVRGLIQGLRMLSETTATGHVDDQGEAPPSGSRSNISVVNLPTARATAAAGPTADTVNNSDSGRDSSMVWASADAATLMQTVAAKAVRTAAGLLGPETARELRAARRKLGLASLTSSERMEKTKHLSRAVEARVLIAGFARALLFEESGGDKRALTSQKTKKPTTSSSSGSIGGSAAAAVLPNGTTSVAKEELLRDAGQLEIDARRALMVSTFQQTEILRDILQPLEDMAVRLRNEFVPTFVGWLIRYRRTISESANPRVILFWSPKHPAGVRPRHSVVQG